MLEDAIKAKIPLIAVTTDDIINLPDVLQVIAKPKQVRSLAVLPEKGVTMAGVYWTLDEKTVTVEMYQRMRQAQSSLVIVNPIKPSTLLFDGGSVPVPEPMLHEFLKQYINAENRQRVIAILKGLSLKAVFEIIMLTVARTGGLLPAEIRKTRLSVAGGVQGLVPLETEEDVFYVWPTAADAWQLENRPFFESPDTPRQLMPRGLMLEGAAGTGKTALARALAHAWKLPLYRLDITQALTKFVGEAENRVLRSLRLVEQESPCVLLIDEVEKIFTTGGSDDTGVVKRILSALLWWLSEHESKVITIMTTNNLTYIPPELYRPGRLDQVLVLPKLGLMQAKMFAIDVFRDVMQKKDVPLGVQKILREAVEETGKAELAHSEVSQLVYSRIKQNKWIKT